MNIIIPIDKINNKNIYFHDAIKNTVINNGDFIRILYTDKYLICNGLQIKFNINPTPEVFNLLCNIEKDILNLYNKSVKHFLKFEEQINFNINKYSHLSSIKNFFIIKISGIWENNIGIGLTCKIIYI